MLLSWALGVSFEDRPAIRRSDPADFVPPDEKAGLIGGRGRHTVSTSVRLAWVGVTDLHDHIAPLVAFLHVAMGLDDLLQRILAIDHRLQLPRLGQTLEQWQIRGKELRPVIVDRDACATRSQRVSRAEQRLRALSPAHRIEDDVVALASARVVLA